MRTARLIAVLASFVTIALITADAQAVYHPGLGRFLQRDPGAGRASPARIGTAGPAVGGGYAQRDSLSAGPTRVGAAGPTAGGRFVQRDPTGQYADGMNLYQYVGSNPLIHQDPTGLYYGYNPDDCEKKYCLNKCGVWKCNKAKRQANKALRKAKELFPEDSLHNGEGDAWRHCYWNCKMVRKIGTRCAKYIADQHEEAGARAKPPQPKAEEAMDYHNNHVGRQLASQEGSCSGLCMQALRDGKLKKLK